MKHRRRRFALDEKDLNNDIDAIPVEPTVKIKVSFVE